MALVSDLSHTESIFLLKTLLTDSVHVKSLLVELCQRHLATCIIHSPLLHHHVRSLLLPLHSSQSSPSPPWARTVSFLSDLVRMRHDNAFPCPSPQRCFTCLSHIVSDSDVYASISVSCLRSCPLTSAGFSFLWRASWIDPSVVRFCHISQSAFPRMSHILHCCQRSPSPLLPFQSAPRSGRFCFRCQHVLDDPPINSGGATRSRHCSLLGGATRTRHDDASSGKRLTVPCDSDFLCISLIRDGLASQHARLLCSPTVLNTVSLVRSSAARGVF